MLGQKSSLTRVKIVAVGGKCPKQDKKFLLQEKSPPKNSE